MAFPGNNYAPPGVYTQTSFEPPTPASLEALKIPVFIGEGNEYLIQQQLDVVRGSSATADQRIVSEDETNHMVVSISALGVVTLGGYDGVLDRFQVSHFPITSGDGSGRATTNRSDVIVTINGEPIVIRTVDGARGIIQIAQPPNPGDEVRCTYYFKRTDTLITDDVSDQVYPGLAIVRALFGIGDVNAPNPDSPVTVLDLHDDILDSQGRVIVDANNVLTLTVDGSTSSIRITPRTNYTMAQIASAITAARVGTLTATTFVDNYGHSALQLMSENSLIVLDASANGILGLNRGMQAPRTATFYTFQGPIVTGSGGGVTATDPSQVTVRVNGIQVIPTAVDGANRAVTLAVAPADGSIVSITYYFNSWQDTFDYLAHLNVSEVISCGDSPGSSSYIQDADFVLQNDKILWGTAVTVESGVHTDLATYFGTDQITTLLVDNRTFLSECSAVVVAGSASQTTFQLPFDPTLGNGRDTPLGQSLFQTVSNSRIDLPVNRPDVVWAYWGWDAQDALERGKVTVLKVEGNVVTLADPVPVGARLFATFYYNTLTDETFTLTCAIPGASGIGTYNLYKTGDQPVYGATFSTSSKGSSLNGITLEFPSGSELTPDVHFEGLSGNDFTGPVTETVSVQFAARQATPARYTSPGAGPYEFISDQSDHLRFSIHSNDIGAAGLDLSNPSEWNGGFFASIVSNEIAYTNGQTYDVPSSEQVLLTIDDVDVLAKTNDALTAVDISVFADAINVAASGGQGLADGAEAAPNLIKMPVALQSNITDRYVGWKVVIGQHLLGGAAPGDEATVTAYDGTTFKATVAPVFSGNIANNTPFYIYDPAARAAMAGTTVFTGPVTLGVAKHNQLTVNYHGTTSGVVALQPVISTSTAVAVGTITVGAVGVADTVTIDGAGAGPAVVFTYNVAPNPAIQTFSDAATLAAAINDPATQLLLVAAIGYPVSVPAETISAVAVGTVCTITYSVAGYHGLLVTMETNNAVTIVLSNGGGVGPNPLAFPTADYTFATVGALALGVQAALNIAIADACDSVGGNPDFLGLAIECTANANNQLQFQIQLPGLDSAGFIQFLDTPPAATADFAVLAGLDTASGEGLGQAALLQGPVAKTYECPAAGALKPYDRLLLRNRILPGGGPNSSMNAAAVVAQANLSVKSASTLSGLEIGMFGLADRSATVKPATLSRNVSLTDGFSADAEVQLTFYDGSGSRAANDTFDFTLDGVNVSVTFVSSGPGTVRALGPTSIGGSTTVLDQIQDALAAVAGTPFGTRAQIYAAKIVRQEGCGIRITGLTSDTTAGVTIGSGSANATLGFSSGQASLRSTVPAKTLASALNANRNSTTFLAYMTDFTSVDAGVRFAKYGFASSLTDESGLEYLYIQDAPTLVAGLGAASSLLFADASSDNALRYGTLLGTVSGDGATGEAAVNGFFVTSSNASGSGSIDTSILNNGTGQDGIVGQTYRDDVTGLTFTILPRDFHNNPTGPWVDYPTGANATFRFNSSTTFVTNANIPHLAVNGVEMKVANTVGVAVGDSAVVTTHERGGQEPAIGDLYYVTYTYQKQDFTTGFYRSLSAIEANYGAVTPDNPLALAAYMAIINGAVAVGLKQVPRETGSNYGSLTSYRDAITELEGVLPGNVSPDMITPLRGDSTQLFQVLKKSNEIQSSQRYRSERTSIIGVSAGTLPVAAGNLAQTLSHPRMRLVYPDLVVITLQDNQGVTKDYLIDGPFLAAALTGSVCSPNLDVATPWTGRRLVGFTQLGRRLDAVEQNQLAVKGITILEDQPPFLRVRHGLTTDMTNILTKLPTVTLIADEVQQQARNVLETFVGIKFLPGVLSQIEGRLAAMLRQLVAAQIITAYTGVKASVSADDPTTAEVEAYYSPVFPLLYLVVTFHLRSSL